MSDASRSWVAETVDYGVTLDRVKSNVTLDGTDDVYSIVNKQYEVVEVRCYTLPEVLASLQQIQQALDAITGKLKGNAN
jgi:hypothetical protein